MIGAFSLSLNRCDVLWLDFLHWSIIVSTTSNVMDANNNSQTLVSAGADRWAITWGCNRCRRKNIAACLGCWAVKLFIKQSNPMNYDNPYVLAPINCCQREWSTNEDFICFACYPVRGFIFLSSISSGEWFHFSFKHFTYNVNKSLRSIVNELFWHWSIIVSTTSTVVDANNDSQITTTLVCGKVKIFMKQYNPMNYDNPYDLASINCCQP